MQETNVLPFRNQASTFKSEEFCVTSILQVIFQQDNAIITSTLMWSWPKIVSYKWVGHMKMHVHTQTHKEW